MLGVVIHFQAGKVTIQDRDYPAEDITHLGPQGLRFIARNLAQWKGLADTRKETR